MYFRLVLISYMILSYLPALIGQKSYDCQGWTGELIIPDEQFYNVSNWIANASAGNSCSVTASDTCINLYWKLQAGQDQWAQCYMILPEPVSLNNYDIFGFDLHGSACESDYPCHKEQVVEIKFEDGSQQAIHTRMGEDGILCVDRWIDRLFFHKYDDDFSIPESFNWDQIHVISFCVKSHPWVDSPEADSGVFSFRNLVADSTGGWLGTSELELLTVPSDTLIAIKQNALDFILSRQTETGLLTTWAEGGLSWLYGQGLALKILALEGEWDEQYNPINEYAEAAQKLARFLAANQQDEGYWPRAWNSFTGDIAVLHEDDGSIWMGDFPWMLIGLYSYFKKSNDEIVRGSICKGLNFLESLIDSDGKFHTLHVPSGERIPVTSSEAYAAAICALLETGENELADSLISYIHNATWDSDLHYWREGVYSDRVVLFTNTWLSLLLYEKGYEQISLDALKLTGALMYTCGPGEPCGLDGIGPIATWYEGTLSYIAAGGCGSNLLFNTIRPFVNEDGSVPHYNDTIGSTAGIWAEAWASLDGTSWLYYVTAQTSPFDVLTPENDLFCDTGNSEIFNLECPFLIYPNPCSNSFNICFHHPLTGKNSITITNNLGQSLIKNDLDAGVLNIRLNISDLKPGLYTIQLHSASGSYCKEFIKE